MLGIAGIRVLDAGVVDGELEVLVETVDGDGWCRGCGVKARSKGRTDTLLGVSYREESGPDTQAYRRRPDGNLVGVVDSDNAPHTSPCTSARLSLARADVIDSVSRVAT